MLIAVRGFQTGQDSVLYASKYGIVFVVVISVGKTKWLM